MEQQQNMSQLNNQKQMNITKVSGISKDLTYQNSPRKQYLNTNRTQRVGEYRQEKPKQIFQSNTLSSKYPKSPNLNFDYTQKYEDFNYDSGAEGNIKHRKNESKYLNIQSNSDEDYNIGNLSDYNSGNQNSDLINQEMLINQINQLKNEVMKLKKENRILQSNFTNISKVEKSKQTLNVLSQDLEDLTIQDKCVNTIKELSEILVSILNIEC